MTAHANGAFPAGVREAARKLHARGFRPVPVAYRTKTPAGGDGWNAVHREGFDADAEFPDFRPHNLGLLNGQPSGGLVDVDLDCPEARAAGAVLLPPTAMVWGRKSAPGSHYGYRVDDPPDRAAENFDDPVGGHLLELRSTGGMTVVPPSVAPADPDAGKAEEPVIWARDGDPAEVSLADLRSAVASVAAAAVLARHWPKGARHDAALAVSGGLLRAGWETKRVERFLTAVCAAANDPEVKDRVRAAADTAERLADGKMAAGWPAAAKHLGADGEALVKQIREWLGVTPPKAAAAGGTSAKPAGPGRPKYVPLPPFVPFPTHLLPEPWARFVREGAAALGCDESFLALPALATIAGAIGTTRRIYLGRNWSEPAVVFGCIVGESSTLKSPALAMLADPIRDRQQEHIEEYETAVRCHEEDLARWAEAKKAHKAGDGPDPGDKPAPPTLKRIYCADTTIERLAELLHDNPRGLLALRDELAGWFGSFTRYKGKTGGSDLPNWLETHRAGPIVVDRKTGDRKFTFVPRAAVSVVGGIQPSILASQLTPEFMASGLTARVLFAYPPRHPKEWREDEVSPETQAAIRKNLEDLYALDTGTDDKGRPKPTVVKLSPAAKKLWVAFYNEWGKVQHAVEGDTAAAFGKIEAYAARLGLLHHVVTTAASDAGTSPVGEASLAAGVGLARWFAAECERVYRMLAEDEEERDVRRLVEHVRRQGGRTTAKQLQRSNQRKYRSAVDAEWALLDLERLGLGRWETTLPGPKGGRPSRWFVLCVTYDETDETDSDDDPPERGDDGTGGDETPEGAKRPPNGPAGGNDASPQEADGNGSNLGESPEVSSVSSHVTHDSETRNAVPDGTENPRGGFVTPERVSSHAPGYTLVTDPNGLARVVAVLESHHGPVGLDCETTGLNPARDRVRLIQLAVGPDVFVIDTFSFPDPAAALAGPFEMLARSEVVGHNLASFDLPFLARLGFHPDRVFDTLLASKVLHGGDDVGHGLADAAERELGRTLDKSHQKDDWSGTLTPGMLAYAAADVAVLVPLAETLIRKAEAAGLTPVLDLEMRAAVPVARMAAAGVGFDPGPWIDAAATATADRDRLRAELDILSPDPAGLPGIASRNWNSRDQVLAALKGVGLDPADTTEETLAALDHPLAAAILAYRGVDKAAGTYGREWVDRHVVGGRVYATWKQYGARTGRMSCGDPNLQQVPRGAAYRRSFAAPLGRVLVKADYSQIELRIAAKVTGDARMMEAYRAGLDLHTLTAARFLGVPAAEVPKAARQTAKPVNFGAIYGLSAPSLKRKAKAEYGKDITVGEAAGFLDAFFGEFPGVRRWHDAFKRRPPKQVRTLGGRAVALPPTAFFGTCANYVVQGTGGDGLKRALVLLWDRRAEVPDARVVLAVHDEVVVEVPELQAESAAAWLARAMTDAMAPLIAPVPVVVEPAIGPTWGG